MEFEVYDNVWIISHNRITEKMIYSKTQTMNFGKTGVDWSYKLVNGVLGAGVTPNEAKGYAIDEIFATKDELVASL